MSAGMVIRHSNSIPPTPTDTGHELKAPELTPARSSALGTRQYVQIILLVLMCWNMTAVLQYWVGGNTVYAEESRAARAARRSGVVFTPLLNRPQTRIDQFSGQASNCEPISSRLALAKLSLTTTSPR